MELLLIFNWSRVMKDFQEIINAPDSIEPKIPV